MNSSVTPLDFWKYLVAVRNNFELRPIAWRDRSCMSCSCTSEFGALDVFRIAQARADSNEDMLRDISPLDSIARH